MPAKGERHHNAKLSDAKVKAMRVVFENWKERGLSKGYGHAAKLFGCPRYTARDILTYRTRLTYSALPENKKHLYKPPTF